MSKSEELYAGSMHVDKIGKVVVVDIEGTVTRGIRGGLLGTVKGRVIAAGVLHGISDEFQDDRLTRTTFTVDTTLFILDWDSEDVSARIEVQGKNGKGKT